MEAKLMLIYSIAAVFITVILAATFVGLYHFLSVRDGAPWYRNPLGRHLMTFVMVDGIVFAFLGTAYIFPGVVNDVYRWFYLVVGVSGIPWTICWRILILWRLYHPKNDLGGSE